MTVTHFFGDGEKPFALPYELATELEKKTGFGIGALFGRLINRTFALADIVETIRLGLIGGGASPQDASRLVDAYAKSRPLTETFPIALAVLESVWFGTDAKPDAIDADKITAGEITATKGVASNG